MVKTHEIQEAPIDHQIQSIVENIVALKEKIEGTKIILKEYKIESPELDALKKKQKTLNETIGEEKERIEGRLLEDIDYEKASNEILTLKNEFKEQKALLAQALKKKNKIPGLQTENMLVKSGQMKLQLEFTPVIFLDGKELKI